MRPLIGITSRELSVSSAQLPANGTFMPYVEAISWAGASPVLIPLCANPSDWVPSIVEALHGVLFTGGEDIAPSAWEDL